MTDDTIMPEEDDTFSEKDDLGASNLEDLYGADSLFAQANNETSNRQKRQSPGREALCQVSTQFITPQAALNSRGN